MQGFKAGKRIQIREPGNFENFCEIGFNKQGLLTCYAINGMEILVDGEVRWTTGLLEDDSRVKILLAVEPPGILADYKKLCEEYDELEKYFKSALSLLEETGLGDDDPKIRVFLAHHAGLNLQEKTS